MKHLVAFVLILFSCPGLALASTSERDVVQPVIGEQLIPERLTHQEMAGGELDRRIMDLVYKNYMVIDLDRDWLDKFKKRTDRGDKRNEYYGIGKVLDAGSLFAQYTGDSKVAQRSQYIMDQLRSSRNADGYLGFWNVDPILDDSIRPDGPKVIVKAWTNPECTGDQVDVVLTEFTDPDGIAVYFKVSNLDDTHRIRIMDDELLSEPRKSANGKIRGVSRPVVYEPG